MDGKDKLKINIDELIEPVLHPNYEDKEIAALFSYPVKFVDFETYEKFAVSELVKEIKYIDNHVDNRMPEGKENVVLTTGLFNALCNPFILKFAVLRYLSYIFDKDNSNIYIISDISQLQAAARSMSSGLFINRLRTGFINNTNKTDLHESLFRIYFSIVERHGIINQKLYIRTLAMDFIFLEAINFILSYIYISTGRFLLDHVHSYVPGRNLETFFDALKHDFTDCK